MYGMETIINVNRPSDMETTKPAKRQQRDNLKPAPWKEHPASSRIRYKNLKAVLETIPFERPGGNVLLIEPSEAQMRQLASGDGHADISGEFRKRYSSTALAVNYYLQFQKATGNLVSFEEKVAKPLLGKGKAANLDVVHYEGERIVFVESKFLEPFYDDYRSVGRRRERLLPYLDESRYPFPDVALRVTEKFRELDERISKGELTYVEVEQLFKHAMAIYRAVREGSVRRNARAVLRLVRWRPSEAFVATADCLLAGLGVKVKERENEIVRELDICRREMSRFLETLGASDFLSFDCSTYDEMLEHLGFSETVGAFKRMYFFT